MELQLSAVAGASSSHTLTYSSGTLPITNVITGQPAGVTISGPTLSFPSSLTPGVHRFKLQSQNCSGTVDVDVVLSVYGDCGATVNPDNGQTVTDWVVNGAPQIVPESFVGIHQQLTLANWQGGGNVSPITYDIGRRRTLAATAMGREEIWFWRNIEKADGTYDWTATDQWMAAHDGPVTFCLYGTPEKYQLYPGEPSRWPAWDGCCSPPTDAGMTAMANFVVAAVTRYSQIDSVEVSNEPTFPWGIDETDFTTRWSPAWAASAGLTGTPATPFFSGSPTDLANMTAVVKRAMYGRGVAVLGNAWVDLDGGANSIERFMYAPVTFGNLGLTGKDHIDGMSVHFYRYGQTAANILGVLRRYKAKMATFGMSSTPMWLTEVGGVDSGEFTLTNPIANNKEISFFVLVPAALGFKGSIMYIHAGSDRERHNLADIANNPTVQAHVGSLTQIGGKQICYAGTLANGQFWAYTSEGRHWYAG